MEDQEARILEVSQEQIREQSRLLTLRAEGAEALLRNTVLVEWFKESQDNLLNLVDTVPLNDTVARDRIYTTLALLRKLKQSLETYVEEGKNSKEDLSKYLELKEKGLLGRLFNV